jgi:hypothetical protein
MRPPWWPLHAYRFLTLSRSSAISGFQPWSDELPPISVGSGSGAVPANSPGTNTRSQYSPPLKGAAREFVPWVSRIPRRTVRMYITLGDDPRIRLPSRAFGATLLRVVLSHDAGRYSQRQGALNLSLCEDQSGAGVSAFPAGAALCAGNPARLDRRWPVTSGTPWGRPVLTGRNSMTKEPYSKPPENYSHLCGTTLVPIWNNPHAGI